MNISIKLIVIIENIIRILFSMILIQRKNMKTKKIVILSMISTILILTGCGSQDANITANDGAPSNGLTEEEENIRLTQIEDIILSDTLIWSNIEHLNPYTVNYFTAESRCNSMILADYTDWRLPVKTELYALAKDSTLKQRFDYISEFAYWTSETTSTETSLYLNQLDYKVAVKMESGSLIYTHKESPIHHVLCVRERPMQ